MNYNVNWDTIAANLIPSFLRKTKFLNLMYSLFSAIQTPAYLKFNSQTIYIEKFLNDTYDATSTRIYITNNNQTRNKIYHIAEAATKTYLYNIAEAGANTYFRHLGERISTYHDYTIYVPSSLMSVSDKITASTNLLNPANKTFNIVSI